MKRTLLASFILTASLNVHAEELTVDDVKKAVDRAMIAHCTLLSGYVYNIVEMRENGEPLYRAYNYADAVEEQFKRVEINWRGFADSLYTNMDVRTLSANETRDTIFSHCMSD